MLWNMISGTLARELTPPQKNDYFRRIKDHAGLSAKLHRLRCALRVRAGLFQEFSFDNQLIFNDELAPPPPTPHPTRAGFDASSCYVMLQARLAPTALRESSRTTSAARPSAGHAGESAAASAPAARLVDACYTTRLGLFGQNISE